MTTFVTLVTHIENLELRKDTGQIPFQMHKLAGYDATVVSYFYKLSGGRRSGALRHPPHNAVEIDCEYPFLNTEVPGLKIQFMSDRGRGKFYERSVLNYLWTRSRHIDVLNLFHFTADSIFYSIIYKLRNPAGKVYLKLDIDVGYYKSRQAIINLNSRLAGIKKYLFDTVALPFFFKQVHTISAESNSGATYFIDRFNAPREKVSVVPNGVDANRVLDSAGKVKSYHEKENMLITVGRIGSRQKNTSMLLKSLPLIDHDGWSYYFTGTIENDFEREVDELLKEFPRLKGRVFLTGMVDDPAKLYELYNRAKIFCLTSIDEGFPVSAAEAAFFGNRLVLTDAIHCFDELTNSGEFGTKVPLHDHEQLAREINLLIGSEELLEQSCRGMQIYARDTLTWQSIIPKLHARLSQ